MSKDELNPVFLRPREAKNYQCAICLTDVAKDPMETDPCGHIFCRNCWMQLKEHNPHAQINCPCCRTRIKCVHSSQALKRHAANLEVKCCQDKCDWKGNLSDFPKHIGEDLLGICPKGHFLEKHVRIDGMKRCQECQVRASTLYRCEECPYSTCFKCYLKKCVHNPEKTTRCEHVPLRCKYARHGCEFMGNKAERLEHYESAKDLHNDLLHENVQKLSDENMALHLSVKELEKMVFENVQVQHTHDNNYYNCKLKNQYLKLASQLGFHNLSLREKIEFYNHQMHAHKQQQHTFNNNSPCQFHRWRGNEREDVFDSVIGSVERARRELDWPSPDHLHSEEPSPPQNDVPSPHHDNWLSLNNHPNNRPSGVVAPGELVNMMNNPVAIEEQFNSWNNWSHSAHSAPGGGHCIAPSVPVPVSSDFPNANINLHIPNGEIEIRQQQLSRPLQIVNDVEPVRYRNNNYWELDNRHRCPQQ